MTLNTAQCAQSFRTLCVYMVQLSGGSTFVAIVPQRPQMKFESIYKTATGGIASNMQTRCPAFQIISVCVYEPPDRTIVPSSETVPGGTTVPYLLKLLAPSRLDIVYLLTGR